ncbi:MAG: hypothetical protein E6K55_14540 [Gemmatimonadetes bacterium]|nr:MAG: hypothetical protein E6K55_14540 [Gemmatimonadota bacterium]
MVHQLAAEPFPRHGIPGDHRPHGGRVVDPAVAERARDAPGGLPRREGRDERGPRRGVWRARQRSRSARQLRARALAGPVFSVERVESLAVAAQRALREAGVANVSVLLGDGTLGWSAYAPYDAILVAAGGPAVPPPLVEQLAPEGRILIPLGKRGAQVLTLVERTGSEGAHAGALRHTPLGSARFVPLVGEHGFDA